MRNRPYAWWKDLDDDHSDDDSTYVQPTPIQWDPDHVGTPGRYDRISEAWQRGHYDLVDEFMAGDDEPRPSLAEGLRATRAAIRNTDESPFKGECYCSSCRDANRSRVRHCQVSGEDERGPHTNERTIHRIDQRLKQLEETST